MITSPPQTELRSSELRATDRITGTAMQAAGAVEAHNGTRGKLRGGGWFDVDVAEHRRPRRHDRAGTWDAN